MSPSLNEDIRAKRHLYLRAGFGLTLDEEAYVRTQSLDDCIESVLDVKGAQIQAPAITIPEDFRSVSKEERKAMDAEMKKNKLRESRQLKYQITWDWVRLMAKDIRKSSPVYEKMVLFWHGHFACDSIAPDRALGYLRALRDNAMGNFRQLVLDVSRTNSMLVYLNGNKNNKTNPNENFARELLELFTLGEGNYTEKDIKEAARAFTGWKYSQTDGFFVRDDHHDDGVKTFLGETGSFEGEDIVDIILEQEQCAFFIAQKLCTYLYGNVTPDREVVLSASKAFYDSGYEISALVRDIISNPGFYDASNYGERIKSPVELLTSMVKTGRIRFERPGNCTFVLKMLGQELFMPPSVKGWEEGEAWINSSSILLRLNLIEFMTGEIDFTYTSDYMPEKENFTLNPRRFKNMAYSFNGYYKLVEEDSRWEATIFANLLNLDPETVHVKDGTPGKADVARFITQLMKTPEFQVC